jgi:threonine synthase
LLYITTRDNSDAFTAHHALTEDHAQDGGRYIPFRFPQFSAEEILALKEKSFGQIIAEVLNTFFSTQLTGWDVDFCIGRNVLKICPINHRIAVAELWHNPISNYSYVVNSLYTKITNQSANDIASEWFQIAVRIAILFGLYGELQNHQVISEAEPVDVSVPAGDLSAPMAAYYARIMGLPVQRIICSDLDNSVIWDFVQRGTLNTSTIHESLRPGIERLIHATLGYDSIRLFRDKCQRGQVFGIDETQHKCISDVFFCSVVGATRIHSIISSVYRSNSYIVEPSTALCHGGLQDYRAKTGNSRTTLILAETTPLSAREQICSAIGIEVEKLTDHINLS